MTNSNHFHDTPYYIDLLSLVSSFKVKNESYFTDLQEFSLGIKPNVRYKGNELMFAGAEQVEDFLNDFEINQNYIDNVIHISFYDRFDFNKDQFKSVFNIIHSCSLLKEGTLFNPNVPYGKIICSEFFFNVVSSTIMRICEFQTLIATEANMFMKLGPRFINLGTKKAQTITAAAYEARAMEIAGVMRFISPQKASERTVASKEFRRSSGFSGWNVKSNTIVNHANRKEILQYVGYNSQQINDFWSSGIYAIHINEYYLNHLTGFSLDGSIANELNQFMNLNKESLIDQLNTEYLLIDSYYQHIFMPQVPSDIALYGVRGKDIPKCIQKYNSFGVIRAKRNVIPKILVNNIKEINEIVSCLNEEFAEKNIYFRGQNRHFKLKRTDTMKLFLYGSKDVDELSLLTSASRNNVDFDSFFALLQLHFQGFIYSELSGNHFDNPQIWDSLYQPKAPFDNKQIEKLYLEWRFQYNSFEWDNTVTGLAQHYGIPTHGIDITDSLESALWFALNEYYEYQENDKSYSWYRESVLTDIIEDLPVIYLVATDNVRNRELDGVKHLNIDAKRPVHQRALLHYGGWGFHTNICAEDVVAALFLSPDFEIPELPKTEYMFPSTEKDKFYAELIRMKEVVNKKVIPVNQIANYKPPSTR